MTPETLTLAEQAPVYQAKPKGHPRRPKAYNQALEIQRFLFQDATNPKTSPRDRAMVAGAWEKLEERKRILKMKPLPKSVDVTKTTKLGRAKKSPEPLDPDASK